jgi:tryptophan synthase alpha chain
MGNRIMAHLVAFYPSEEHSLETARALVDGGASYLEVQFPFSEPTADGPAIQRACARALENGFSVAAGFRLLERIRRLSEIPLFVMSYANLVFRGGIESFVKRCRDAGARGLIVPDLPPDSDEGLYAAGRAAELDVVPVIVPSLSEKRMDLIGAVRPAYIYVALRRGITGAATVIDGDNLSFLSRLSQAGMKILAGFGISERTQVEALAPHVHAVVVGSTLIEAAGAGSDGGRRSPYEAVLSKMRSLV